MREGIQKALVLAGELESFDYLFVAARCHPIFNKEKSSPTMMDCLIWQQFEIHEVPYVRISRIRGVFRMVGGWEIFWDSHLRWTRTILNRRLSSVQF